MSEKTTKRSAAGGANRYWVLMQGADLRIEESEGRPDTTAKPGERLIVVKGAYSTREAAEGKLEKLRELPVAGQ